MAKTALDLSAEELSLYQPGRKSDWQQVAERWEQADNWHTPLHTCCASGLGLHGWSPSAHLSTVPGLALGRI